MCGEVLSRRRRAFARRGPTLVGPYTNQGDERMELMREAGGWRRRTSMKDGLAVAIEQSRGIRHLCIIESILKIPS